MNEESLELMIAEEDAVAHVQAMIVRLLREKNLSQKELARRMGVSASYVSQILADEPKNLSVKQAAGIFFRLGEELEFNCRTIRKMDSRGFA